MDSVEEQFKQRPRLDGKQLMQLFLARTMHAFAVVTNRQQRDPPVAPRREASPRRAIDSTENTTHSK